ncbi:MAG: methyl-accepting chemotaxis protein [Erythrobacter sp.]|uniref:methyl-accepting chemotaxis protein n=1 Tax=Erythrobacter sp. TaxID=1042 RepID=UPI0032EE89FD
MAHRPLQERLEFYGIERQDPAYRAITRAISRRMDRALDDFYAEISSRDELAAKFDDSTMMERARRAQAQHWRSVFENGVSDAFRDRAAHIGAVHARIGLEPKYYVGSYARILDDLVQEIIAPGWKRFLPWKRAEARRVTALLKVSLLDIEIALSSYFFDIKGKVSALNEVLGSALEQLAAGKLDLDRVELPVEYAQVAADFNSTVAALLDTITAVVEGVDAITIGSSEIRSAADDLSRRTEEQAANLEETAAAVAQTTQRVMATSETTGKARVTIEDTNAKADDGSKIVAEAVTAMDQIESSSQEITNIISVIDSIAFQTNLLALNAGVEAARAGETGKGFAVVASEVRALAQRCADAADEVKSLITVSNGHVSSGVDLVKRSGEAFAAITQGVAELSDAMQEIAASTEVQAESLAQINTVVADLDQSTQRNAAMAEQCTAAAGSLAGEAEKLGLTVAQFDVGARRGGAAELAETGDMPQEARPVLAA